MGIVKKVLKMIVVIILVFIVGLSVLLLIMSKQPAVKKDYFEKVRTDKPLEAKYTAKGSYEVSFSEFNEEDATYQKFEVWYPSMLEAQSRTYPLIIMVNGTGVPASKYAALFEHLASWGFIVVGNEDPSSWSGDSPAKSLDHMLALNDSKGSIFYQKIDTENIGIAGHSQGGVGAINAVANQPNGHYYKAIYTASAANHALAEALQWTYDVSRVTIPYFMTAGTLKADAGDGVEGSSNTGIAPLWSLRENFNAISGETTKIFSRRVDTDHGDMLFYGDGYMTAWFMYYLNGDTEAGKAFFGDEAEILFNQNWQDTHKNC